MLMPMACQDSSFWTGGGDRQDRTKEKKGEESMEYRVRIKNEAYLYQKEFLINQFSGNCSLYYKHITIVKDDSSVINKLETSLIDDTRVVIYDHHMFIVQATGVPRENPLQAKLQGQHPYFNTLYKAIDLRILDTYAGKQLSYADTDVSLILALKNELHLNIDQNFGHQMSLSKSKCWYSNNCSHFLKRV